ncbi:MFS transporter [Cellulomonas sp. URHD0024]|uniref:MFS transporter n=1 Tax=Cellulomonas sp. URHD0024 TaxID=1302620 RepID=UPI000406ABE7|nr:MFS transporter [Cellulomonas sp. URHD0024]
MTTTSDVREAPAGPVVRSRVLAVCLVVGFATLVDQAILTVAVPSIRGSLSAGTSEVQWILAAYSLAFAVALVPAGRLGDARGRRALLIGGVAAFSVFSLVGATAHDPAVVVIARLLQGAGAGTANPQVIGLVQDHFPGRERTRALGLYATVGAFAGVVAPLIGGTVIGVAGTPDAWRWVMVFNVPFGLAAAVLGWRWLPRRSTVPRTPDLDLTGLGLLAAATVALLVPVVVVSGGGDRATGPAGIPTVAYATLFALAVAGFVLWERRYARRGRTPILLPQLIGNRGFALGTAVAMFSFGAALGSSLVLTLFLQEGLGLTALHAGLVSTPAAVIGGVASALAWRISGGRGRSAVTWSFGVVVLGTLATLALVVLAPPTAAVVGITITLVVTSAAGGLAAVPNQSLTLGHATAGAHGLAAGFLQVSQRISSTVCIAGLGGVVLASAVPGDLGSYRRATATGLAITAGLVLCGAVCSWLDRTPRSSVPTQDVTTQTVPTTSALFTAARS